MSKNIEICVHATTEETEHVSYLLMDRLGCSGTAIYEDGTVKGYLPTSKEIDLSPFEGWKVTTKIIKDEEWAENWKRYWQPQKIGRNIVICPSWEHYTPEKNDVIINLDPGSAFGTGTHPTTRLCVQALEKIVPEFDKKIIMADIGTGSGILAIIAAKLKAEKIVGVDNDASVIPVASENSQINNVDNICEFYTGSAADIKGKYEIITANILAEVIIEILNDLKNLLKPDGVMILSGIIDKKLPDVKAAMLKASIKIRDIYREENWVAIIAGF